MVRLRDFVISVVCVAGLAFPNPVLAARRALLIGAGEFPNAPAVHSLAGPANDVESLRGELVSKWEVPPENIVVLLNQTASRKRILQELEALTTRSHTGDTAVLYYSGHGTSAHDPVSNLKLDLSTGAIVPADFTETRDANKILDQLIIGTRDIRPFLERMDKSGVRVLVLFDACYSGDSAKSIGDLVARNADSLINSVVAPEVLTAFNQALEDANKTSEAWPYQNVVYISASARHEVAWDISAAEAKRGRPTIDGKAHGAFTNAVLLGLRGAADTNHDKQVSYVELHGYLVRQLERDGQTPQLHPRDSASGREPVLDLETNHPAAPTASTALIDEPHRPDPGPPPVLISAAEPEGQASFAPLRVRLATPSRDLQTRIAAISGVQVVTGAYDLEILGQAPRFRLMHSAGTAVTPDALREEDLLRIIAQRARANPLTNVEYPKQDFNVELFMTPDQGAYYLGEHSTIGLRPERTSWILVFDTDVEGNVYLVYPNRPEDRRQILAGETIAAVEVQAAEPTGTETIQVFAMTEMPANYYELLRSVRLSNSQLANLIENLRRDANKPGRSQVRRTTYTLKH